MREMFSRNDQQLISLLLERRNNIYCTHSMWMEVVGNYKFKNVQKIGKSYKYRKEILSLVQAPKYVINEDSGIINKRFY
jgi:hypothetical protein